MVGNLLRKYGGIIKRDYIEEVVRKFERVRSIIFYNGDIEQIIDSYLHYDRLINDFNNNISKLKNDIEKCKKMKYEVLNKSVLKLRSEGKLLEWLNELNDKDLNEIKDIVDIESEYRKIDDYRFNESKKNRGKVAINY